MIGRHVGWWQGSKVKAPVCGTCGEPAVDVPREGHELSEFWRLERPGERLIMCPGDCKEEK